MIQGTQLRRFTAWLLILLIVWGVLPGKINGISQPSIAEVIYTDLPDTNNQTSEQNKKITIIFNSLQNIKADDRITLDFPQFIGLANTSQMIKTNDDVHIATLSINSTSMAEGASWKIVFNKNAEKYKSIDNLKVSIQDRLRDTFHSSGEPNIQINLPVKIELNGQTVDNNISKTVSYKTLKDHYTRNVYSIVQSNGKGGANLFIYSVFRWPNQHTSPTPLIVTEIAKGVDVPSTLVGRTYSTLAKINLGKPVINTSKDLFWRADLPGKTIQVKVVDVKETPSGTTRITFKPLSPLQKDIEYWIQHKDFLFNISDPSLYSFNNPTNTTIKNKIEIYFDGVLQPQLTNSTNGIIGNSDGGAGGSFPAAPFGSVEILKYDADTKQAIGGSTFNLILDSLADPTNYPDYKKIVGKVIRDHLVAGPDGKIIEKNLPPGNYTLKEIKPPVNYYCSKEDSLSSSELTFSIKTSEDIEKNPLRLTMSNKMQTGNIAIQKYDIADGKLCAPDASLDGAEYAVRYIAYPDHLQHKSAIRFNGRIIKPGDTLGTITTRNGGRGGMNDLPLGTYDLIETKASSGYTLNQTAIRFSLLYDQSHKAVSTRFTQTHNNESILKELNDAIDQLNARAEEKEHDRRFSHFKTPDIKTTNQIITYERPAMGFIEINKIINVDPDGWNTDLNIPETGIKFEIRRDKEVVDIVTTTPEGFAISKLLPLGTYTVHEVNESLPPGILPMEPHSVTLSKDGQGVTLNLENKPVETTLRIIKIDAETEERIPVGGIEFKIYKEKDGGKALVFDKRDIFTTDDNGILVIPKTLLGTGTYYLEEINAPEGYHIPVEQGRLPIEIAGLHTDVTVTIQDETVPNIPQKGQIILEKKGQVLTDWIEEVVTLVVREPMDSPTDETSSEPIPNLSESTEETVSESLSTLKANDPSVPTNETEASTTVPTTMSTPVKTSSLEQIVYKPVWQEQFLPDATFEIIADEDIFSRSAKQENGQWQPILLHKKGTVVDTFSSTSDGPITSKELPLGKYKIIETVTPEGYLRADPIHVELTPGAQSIRVQTETKHLINEKQTYQFVFTKSFEESQWFNYHTETEGSTYFGLFTKLPLTLNNVTLPADTCVGITALDQNYAGSFSIDLAGEYYIKELSTHEAYHPSENSPVTATYRPDGDTKEVVTLIEPIKNELKRGGINVIKVDSETGQALPGAIFRLYTIKDEKTSDLGLFTSDQNGKVSITNLEYGRYFLEEITPPKGYTVDDRITELTIDGIKDLILEITNTKTVTEISKTNDSEELLPGAAFLIKDRHDQVVSRFTSSQEPSVVRGLIAGEVYTLIEEIPPSGYVLSPDPVTFTVNEDGTINRIQLQNEQTRVVINKRDALTNLPLSGAEICVWDEMDNIAYEGSTDKSGQIKILGLIPGNYTYKEVRSPEGYIENKSKFSFTIDDKGEVIGDLEILNEPTELIIRKTDEKGHILAGAQFKITDTKGWTYRFRLEEGIYMADPNGEHTHLKTDAEGQIRVRYLPQQTYHINETKSPDGYALAGEVSVEISENSGFSTPLCIEIENQRLSSEKTTDSNNAIQVLPRTGEVPPILLNLLFFVTGTVLILIAVLKKIREKYK